MKILSPNRYFKKPQTSEAPEGSLIYAVGDIHGRLDLLARMHALIEADAASCRAGRKVVVYLGDYVDRGPDSRGVVEYLLQQPLAEMDSVYLIGNHEAFLLTFLDDPSTINTWFMNGGDATLRSYGVDPWEVSHSENFPNQLRQSLLERLPESHRTFYRTLALAHEEGDYLFVHAGVRPGVPLKEQNPQDLIWIREDFLSSDEDHGKVVVHGHTPMRAPQSHHNRIGIDTGAVYGGKLTTVALQGTERRFLQV